MDATQTLNKLVTVQTGSHLYGTVTETSDRDYKSIYVPTGQEIVLNRARKSVRFGTKHEQEKQIGGRIARNKATDVDHEAWTLAHFFSLLEEGDSTAIDLLFAQDSHVVHQAQSGVWKQIVENRDRLLTKKIEKSLKYSQQQAAKYGLKGSRVAECRTLRTTFERAMLQNRKTLVEDVKEEFESLVKHMRSVFIKPIKQSGGNAVVNHLDCFGKLISYKTNVECAFVTLDLYYKKYGQRALEAEANKNIDWKALAHTLRVGFQTQELLSSKHITFPRPEAELLQMVRCGKLQLAAVEEMLALNETMVQALARKSTLSDNVDKVWMEDFICRIYGCSVLEMQL